MRTFTTEKGVEYDVEVLDVLKSGKHSHAMIEATIEQGSKMFWISLLSYQEKPDKDLFEEILQQDDLIEVEKWILEKTFGWVEANQYNTSELQSDKSYDVMYADGTIEPQLSNMSVCYRVNEMNATHFRKHIHND